MNVPGDSAIAIAEAPARILRVQRDAFNASRFPDAQAPPPHITTT